MPLILCSLATVALVLDRLACANPAAIFSGSASASRQLRRREASLADLANQFSSAPKRLPSTRADNGSKYIMFLFGVVAFCVFCCCMALNSVERERRLWTQQPQQQVHQQRAIQPYYRAVYAERIQPLPTPPLPLSTEIDHSSFALDCNVDFRHEQYPRTSAFRGGARYSLPLGCYRYALSVSRSCVMLLFRIDLQVLGKYPDDDDWLRSDGDVGEWQVAYHGTTCENVSGIIKNGFDLEKCQRFTYGKGIYCSPDPSVAKSYSVAYHVERRWYKAVVQVRVHPTLKRIAFNENKEEYWIIPYAEAIRAYGVCVYDVAR
ncbi:hypothetical protein AAVH_18640 [Aphelenchoides avenae]|nr:hypothetical protein AAVH_18640 [Aphelenchus avenae]